VAPKIFICYRREDTRPTAGRIHDSLASEFGSAIEIFRDVKGIPYGETFVSVVEKAVEDSNIFLVLIGSKWLDEFENRRNDAVDDPVHFEIAAAIRRKVPIIPILVDGARLPKSKELPEEIASLSTYNGLQINNDHFEDGLAKLVSALRTRLPKRRFTVRALSLLGAIAVLSAGSIWIWEQTQSVSESDVASPPNLAASQKSPTPKPSPLAAPVDAIDLLDGAWTIVDGGPGERAVFQKSSYGNVIMDGSSGKSYLEKTGDHGANIRAKSILGDCYYSVMFPSQGRMTWTRKSGSDLFCLSDTTFKKVR
jgi:TIR domain